VTGTSAANCEGGAGGGRIVNRSDTCP
jgi:hypothetical protein